VISYRVAQYWLPILLGGLAYLSLRVGPWSIARRDRLERFRVLAKEETEVFESGLDWAERYGHRPTDPTLPLERDGEGNDGDRDDASRDDLASPG
jgi:hypothetical protein